MRQLMIKIADNHLKMITTGCMVTIPSSELSIHTLSSVANPNPMILISTRDSVKHLMSRTPYYQTTAGHIWGSCAFMTLPHQSECNHCIATPKGCEPLPQSWWCSTKVALPIGTGCLYCSRFPSVMGGCHSTTTLLKHPHLLIWWVDGLICMCLLIYFFIASSSIT